MALGMAVAEDDDDDHVRPAAPASLEMLPRSDERANLLLRPVSVKEDFLVPDSPVSWNRRCKHGRWHFYVHGAICCVVVAVVMTLFGIGVGVLRAGSQGTARPLRQLDKPAVILVSSDGFRYGYNWKAPTPNIDRMRMEGVEAEPGMIPVFPSKTFPNHYSIATGLYPAYHGIVGNVMWDPEARSNDTYRPGNLDAKWYLGEPIWETVVNQGLQAATYFWPGSQVKRGNWTCDPQFCQQYDRAVPYEDRVDTVLGYFDLPRGKRPSFMTLYFEAPDKPGHQTGPDHPLITAAVVRIDSMIGRLLDGLEKRGLAEDVTIIMVGDHGMVANCEDRMIYLEDLGSDVHIPREWIVDYSPVLEVWPPPEVDAISFFRKMSRGLASGNMKNAQYLEIYLKEQLPPRLHFSESPRIAPIIGLVAEGYTLAYSSIDKPMTCGGQHGYDNAYLSMRTIFIARGPQFARGMKIPSFENVELYQLMTSILGLTPAPNNGSLNFATSLLLPRH